MACYDCYDVNKNDKLRLAERGLLTDGFIHERKLQEFQLGDCWCFVDVGPANDLVRRPGTPTFAKCRQSPRDQRSWSVGAVGDSGHE